MSIKKGIVLSSLWVMVFFFFLCFQTLNGRCQNITIKPAKKELKIGEYLLYRVELFGIPIGWVSLTVKEKSLFEGASCYHIVATGYTNRFFKKIYDVEYNVDVYIDTETFLPYRFYKIRKLKGTLAKQKIDFNWKQKKAIVSDNTFEKIIDLKDKCQDILSSVYYLRVMDIEAERIYNLNIFYGQQPWKVNIKIKSLEKMDIYRQGTFDVFLTEISTELSQVILGTYSIKVYFTNDEDRIPVIFYLRIPFGQLKGRIYNTVY